MSKITEGRTLPIILKALKQRPALAPISMQRIQPLVSGELEAESAALPPGHGGVGGEVGLAQDG